LSQLVDTSPVLTESPTRADQDTATLYDCYGSRIREYCYGQLRDRQEADDAVQSTFLYAFTLLRRGETPRKPLPWLYTIAHNVCRTRRRALKRRSRVESCVDLDAVQETIGRNDPTHEDLAQLASSLAQLPLSQRTALLLREWQGLSYSEIAAELGLTESAVEAVLFRARRNLAKKLQYVSDRAATIAGAVLLLPSLRRLSSLGTATKTATVTAVLVGSTALLPAGDTPHAARAAAPAVTRSAPSAPERTRVTVRAEHARAPRLTTSAHAAPLDTMTVATGTQPAVVPPAPPVGSASDDGSGAPAPPTASTTPEAPAAAPPVPTAVPDVVQATLDTTTNVVSTVQTTAATVENTVAGATDTVTSTASTVTSQVASAVSQLPTVPSPLQSPPKNTSLPGLPSRP